MAARNVQPDRTYVLDTTPVFWGLTPARVTRGFVVVITLLTALSLAEQYVIHQLGRADLEEYLIAVDLDAEGNLPTWYSSMALLFAAVLLGTIAAQVRQRKQRWVRHWQALSVLLTAMSIDEIAQLHEHLGHLHELWKTHGIFYFAWVIPGAIAVLLTGLVFLRFLLHLPASTRNRFLLAAVVFCAGGLAVEAISGWRAETMGMNNMTASLIATVEEDLEMIGVAIAIVALLRHMAAERMSVFVSAEPKPERLADIRDTWPHNQV
ncbi:MAG: hypothetical protein ABL977_12555 [Candidatus Eisenbacteria bacterium]